MNHRFVIMLAGQLCEYTRYEDIPDEFDHVIEFVPEIPPGPHTKEQHDEIESWIPKFKRLMEIENGSSRKNR
jgi:hypothetical protein